MPDEKKKLQPTRREFLKEAAVLGGAVVGAGTLAGVDAIAPAPAAAQAPLPKAMGHVERDLFACAGCRTCEAVCSLSHEGVNSPALARTWITDNVVGGHLISGITCKQCNSPNCVQSCPVQAITIDAKTGARVIDPKKCQGLQLCIKACPQYPNSPIRFDPARKIAIKCDLCGGDPLCIKYCPESALTLVKEG